MSPPTTRPYPEMSDFSWTSWEIRLLLETPKITDKWSQTLVFTKVRDLKLMWGNHLWVLRTLFQMDFRFGKIRVITHSLGSLIV